MSPPFRREGGREGGRDEGGREIGSINLKLKAIDS